MRIAPLTLLAALAALPVLTGEPPTQHARLWVVRADADAIVEYNLETFEPRQTVKVPRRVVDHPEHVHISGLGEIMFVPAADVPEGGGEADAPRRAWHWNGQHATETALDHATSGAKRADGTTVTQTVAAPFLSATSDSVIWFENRFDKVLDAAGVERSVRASATAWRSGADGRGRIPIATVSSTGPCQCATGACSETCPEWEFWAPNGVVGAFFLVTRLVPGQLGPAYQETRLYRRRGDAWAATMLPRPLERPLAASTSGHLLVAAVLDGGCCGWANEGDDQLVVWRDRKPAIVYDERRRYGNANYDVSFYPADARLAPGQSQLAYTIVPTAQGAGEVRLSSEGKADPHELARLQAALGDLPAVEIVRLDGAPRVPAVIRRAELVGWLSDRELLVAQDGRLVIFSTDGVRHRDTSIPVRAAADAFIR